MLLSWILELEFSMACGHHQTSLCGAPPTGSCCSNLGVWSQNMDRS